MGDEAGAGLAEAGVRGDGAEVGCADEGGARAAGEAQRADLELGGGREGADVALEEGAGGAGGGGQAEEDVGDEGAGEVGYVGEGDEGAGGWSRC